MVSLVMLSSILNLGNIPQNPVIGLKSLLKKVVTSGVKGVYVECGRCSHFFLAHWLFFSALIH